MYNLELHAYRRTKHDNLFCIYTHPVNSKSLSLSLSQRKYPHFPIPFLGDNRFVGRHKYILIIDKTDSVFFKSDSESPLHGFTLFMISERPNGVVIGSARIIRTAEDLR